MVVYKHCYYRQPYIVVLVCLYMSGTLTPDAQAEIATRLQTLEGLLREINTIIRRIEIIEAGA